MLQNVVSFCSLMGTQSKVFVTSRHLDVVLWAQLGQSGGSGRKGGDVNKDTCTRVTEAHRVQGREGVRQQAGKERMLSGLTCALDTHTGISEESQGTATSDGHALKTTLRTQVMGRKTRNVAGGDVMDCLCASEVDLDSR